MRISPPSAFALFLLFACDVGQIDADSADRGSKTFALASVTDFGSNPGDLAMYTHVPEQMPERAPLVVALHGCLMDAAGYANVGWNELADQWKFYVVYPETSTSMSCFLWYDPSNARRDEGQALSIKQMVDYMVGHYDIDPSRIYVTGLSAGGAMTAVMLAAYPDLFAAGAPMAGLPFRCADSVYTSGLCMNPGVVRTPEEWGDRVRSAFPGYTGARPRVSVWHGDADLTVSTINLDEMAKQWTNVHGLRMTDYSSSQEETAIHKQYRNAAGETLVETWSIDGMGHGTAVLPGFEPANGCGQADSFVLSAGICSTYYAGRFFGLEPQETADAGTEAPDAGVAEEDAGASEVDAGGEQPVPDAGTPPEPDAGSERSGTSVPETEGCGCAAPGMTFGWLAPLSLALLLPRRGRR